MGDDSNQEWKRSAFVGGVTYFILFAAAISLVEAISPLLSIPAFDRAPDFNLREPIFILCCWLAAFVAVSANNVPSTVPARALMGAVGAILLLLAETYVALVLEGKSPTQLLDGFATAGGVVRLVGYIAFGLTPMLQLWMRWRLPEGHDAWTDHAPRR